MSIEKHIRSIWSGVYDRFDQVPGAAEIFDTALWTDKQKSRALESLRRAQSGLSIPDGAKTRDYPWVPFLAGLLSGAGRIRVLDYGGAMGQTYFDVLAKIPDAAAKIDYHVLEMASVVDAVPQEIRDLPGLTFIKSLDELQGDLDVVHCGSVLQYIEAWPLFFETLIQQLNPKIFVLSDLLVGDTPSFVTAQNYYDHVKAVQYINIHEFYTFWGSTPYQLSYRSYYNPLSGEEYFPAEALPEDHRIKAASHLIFCRED